MDQKNSGNQTPQLPIFMCMGVSIGMAIGAAMDNIGVGMCLGVGIGVAIGSAVDAAKRAKKPDSDSEEPRKD